MQEISSLLVWVWSFPSLRQTRTRLSSSSYEVQRPSPCSGSQDLLSTFQRSRTRQYDNQRTTSDARTIFIASFMTKSGFALSSAIFSFTKTLYAEGGLFSFATPCSAYMHFEKVEKYNLRSLVSFIGFLLAALVAAWVVVSTGRVQKEVSLVNSR